MARSADEAGKWVANLLAVMPRDNAAAIKIQSIARMFLARQLAKRMRATASTGDDAAILAAAGGSQSDVKVLRALAVKYGPRLTPKLSDAVAVVQQLRKRAILVQKTVRMAPSRKAFLAHRAAKAGHVKPKWMTFKHGAAAEGEAAPGSSSMVSRMAKLRELKALRESQVAPKEDKPAEAEDDAALDAKELAEWTRYEEEQSGKPYWYNATTQQTTWTDPAVAMQVPRSLRGVWEAVTDPDSGSTYFHNKETDETSWTPPALPGAAPAEPEAASPAKAKHARKSYASRWIRRTDEETGQVFYANVDSGETSWTSPAGLSDGTATVITGDWFSKVDEDTGRKFYVHVATGATQWDRPSAEEGYLEVEDDDGSDDDSEGDADSVVVDDSDDDDDGENDEDECVDANGDVWRGVIDESSGRQYWFNERTGESSWDVPEGAKLRKGKIRTANAPTPFSFDEAVANSDMNETLTFTCFVNDLLAMDGAGDHVASSDSTDPLASRLPLSLESHPPALFTTARDGILLCRLVSAVAPDALDVRVIDYSARMAFEDGADANAKVAARDNCQLALSSAQGIGCVFHKEINADALTQGQPKAVLEFVWQIFKHHIVASVSVRGGTPGIIRLASEGEGLDDLLTLPSEALLLRWVNYQLDQAAAIADSGHHYASLSLWGAGLENGVRFAALVRHICPSTSDDVPAGDAAATAAGPEACVTASLSSAFASGVPAWFSVEGLASGNIKLQQAFVSYLLKVSPNMTGPITPSSPSKAATAAAHASGRAGRVMATTSVARANRTSTRISEREAAALEQALSAQLAKDADGENAAATREARTVAQWINALDIDGVYVRGTSLAADVRDGVAVLKVLDAVEPGLVDWGKVNLAATNRYRQVENCNYAVTLGKAMDLHLVNVAGLDLVDGNLKLLLAFLWQLMRYHTLKMLSQLAFDGFAADESEVLAWANNRAAAAAATMGVEADQIRVRSLNDSALATGVFLLYLLSSVRPGCVQWDLVSDGDSRDDHESNARYVLSLARKVGASVFATPEDIVDVKSRALLLLVASLMVAESKQKLVSA